MEIIHWLSNNEYFVAVVNIFSVLGFFLTIWVTLTVRAIKSYYVFRIRVPEHIERLGQLASKLSELKGRFEDSEEEIDVVVASIEAEIEALGRKVKNKEARQHLANLRSKVHHYISITPRNKEELSQVYVELHKVIVVMRNLQADLALER